MHWLEEAAVARSSARGSEPVRQLNLRIRLYGHEDGVRSVPISALVRPRHERGRCGVAAYEYGYEQSLNGG